MISKSRPESASQISSIRGRIFPCSFITGTMTDISQRAVAISVSPFEMPFGIFVDVFS